MAEEKLWGTMLWGDVGRAYYTEVDISQSVTHYVPTETTDGYNVKYPFVTHNGIADYFKGSASGNFSDNQSTECYEDYNFGEHTVDGITYNNVRYITEFIHWLHDRKTKYLQFSEDFIIPVQIMSDIQWDTEKSIEDGHTCKISFDWVQVGKEFSLHDENLNNRCSSCGGYVAPTAIFCQKCGTRLNSNG